MKFIHIHKWNYIFPNPKTRVFPYKVCVKCGEERENGSPSRWYIGNDRQWKYDDALYE